MTANTSPRLALMLPVNSDPFTPDDFTDTFTKIDGRPGVLPIANFGALPVGLTAAQHGNQYLQTDNLAQWMWWKPTSGSTGTWKRTNSVGRLATVNQGSTVSSTSTTTAAGATVATATVTAPGGRDILIHYYSRMATNDSSDHFFKVALVINGSTIFEGVYQADQSSSGSVLGPAPDVNYLLTAPAAGTSLVIAFKISSVHGGTTSATTPAFMNVIEV